MNIREFSDNLQNIYTEMWTTFSSFQKEMNLPCLNECGLCCHNPEVEATTLEMIPMALKILDEGSMDEWYEKLQESGDKACLIFNGKNCGSYNERPSLCRMFGVAGYFNKEHTPTLSVCKLIKAEHPEHSLQAPENTPMMAEWSLKLASLDPNLNQGRKAINLALKEALEKVALWSSYQH